MKIAPMSVELIDSMGSDVSVVNAARVSFAKEHEVFDQLTDSRLIRYLATHGHWTPFGHAFLSFRVKAPIFVARQLVKHQVGLVWNEVSRRYVDDEPEFWFPEVWRKRAENAKQGSSPERCDAAYVKEDIMDVGDGPSLDDWVQMQAKDSLSLYNGLLASGVAPEQARMILPQNMMTEWIWSGSLMAFARVCKLRLDPHAQAETQEVAAEIARLVCEQSNFQHSWKALLA